MHDVLTNIHGKASSAAEKLARITKDLTVTAPVQHHNAYGVATDLANAAEATQRALESRAKEYFTASESALDNRFKADPAREGVYLRCVDWFAREAKNGEGNGYRNIREAVTDDPDFAVAMYNYSWRLMGLPKDHAFTFKEKAVEKFAPEALDYIERSHKLDRLAKKYPAFNAAVHSSFYSLIELTRCRRDTAVDPMTVVAERLASFAAWLDRSSKAWRSPCGDNVPVGRYAEILPWDFDELPTVDFAEHALPLFVPMDQATGVVLPADADLSHPPGQLRAFHRLSHIIFRLEDARLALSPPWRASDDRLPLCGRWPDGPRNGVVGRRGRGGRG
ncbi:MAG: hypothetical protein QM688_07450 [Sphingomonas bacterium]